MTAATASAKKRIPKDKDEIRAVEQRRLERAAKAYISNYFLGISTPPEVDLHDKRYIDMCLNTTISDAAPAAYKAMKANGRMQASCGDGTIGEDVRFVIGLLKGIRYKCVPQELSAGMLLMHLEIVEGLRF